LPDCAQVAVDVKHPKIKKEYTYLIPENIKKSIKIGDVVQVPFNNAKIDGVVTDIHQETNQLGAFKLKKIIKKYDIEILSKHVELSKQLAHYYGAAVIDFMRLMLPPKISFKREWVYFLSGKKGDISSRAYNQQKIFSNLCEHDGMTVRQISKKSKIPVSSVYSALSALIEKGLVIRKHKIIRRKPSVFYKEGFKKPFELTDEQKSAIREITDNMSHEKKPVLLYGVTGSGKTEVYMRLIEDVISKGKKALLLVPEISLTPQMVAIFQQRFPNKVAVLHSRLSTGERFDEWFRIKDKEADIVIGARSAIFAPVDELGLIIIDEEHETSYKQVEYPFYDARKVASLRARQDDAVLIMGSATPSVESYYKALNGKYLFIKMTKRVNDRPLPTIEIVDMKKELKSGNRSMISRKLYENIKATLQGGHQTILFLNRRGHSTFVICRDCGFVLKCNHCDISLTYHFDDKTAQCHYCGYKVQAPDICPKCRSRNIRYFGAGTEKVEIEVNRIFPQAKTMRIDSDSISKKDSLEKYLMSFKKGLAQILIGTQIVAKGLDFPGVSLVGVITVDTAINMPDFRASERAFQLITQVAGRAGRGDFPGKVFVQTYSPDSFAIQAACRADIESFYREELKIRKNCFYPPYCSLLNITFTGSQEKILKNEALKVKKLLQNSQLSSLEVYGPAPCPRFRIKDNFRYSLLLKSRNEEILIKVEQTLKELDFDQKIKVAWDMNPQDML
jgi:primosomal protein N' (replication factor Y)